MDDKKKLTTAGVTTSVLSLTCEPYSGPISTAVGIVLSFVGLGKEAARDSFKAACIATLGPVPESGLIERRDAVSLTVSLMGHRRSDDLRHAKARTLVAGWCEKWEGDTTHTGMQDGKIVRQRFAQWVQRDRR